MQRLAAIFDAHDKQHHGKWPRQPLRGLLQVLKASSVDNNNTSTIQEGPSWSITSLRTRLPLVLKIKPLGAAPALERTRTSTMLARIIKGAKKNSERAKEKKDGVTGVRPRSKGMSPAAVAERTKKQGRSNRLLSPKEPRKQARTFNERPLQSSPEINEAARTFNDRPLQSAPEISDLQCTPTSSPPKKNGSDTALIQTAISEDCFRF